MKRFLGVFILGSFCFLGPGTTVFAQARQLSEENSSAALEMIALQMQSLSASLAGMPEPPKLNQTIQLPLEGQEEKESSPLPKTQTSQ